MLLRAQGSIRDWRSLGKDIRIVRGIEADGVLLEKNQPKENKKERMFYFKCWCTSVLHLTETSRTMHMK